MTQKLVWRTIRLPRFVTAALIVLWLAAAATGAAQVVQPASNSGGAMVLIVDPDNSKIHWTLGATLHSVRGTFKLKSGTLRLDTASGKAGGEIVAAATSGDSGNEGRDNKMHKDVLESAKFQDIIFKPDRVEGKVAGSGGSSALVHGIMTLHGRDHEIGIPVQAELLGGHWKATGKFTVPYVKWGLKNPSTFLLHVKPDVDIELNLSGTWKTTPGEK